jgi:hypothetical protein
MPVEVFVLAQAGELVRVPAQAGAERVHLKVVVHAENQHPLTLPSQPAPGILRRAADPDEGHRDMTAVIDDVIERGDPARFLPMLRLRHHRTAGAADAVYLIGDQDQMAGVDAQPGDVLPVLHQVAALGLINHMHRAALPRGRQAIPELPRLVNDGEA